LTRREAKPREHGHEDETIPDLQPPFDGFENFHYFVPQFIKPNLKQRLSGKHFEIVFALRFHSMQ
jgi:hypothetical protein